MVRHRGTVPVDTNVILEAHRTGSWPALAGDHAVETVEDCVTETHTGFQRRQPEHRIDQAELRDRLAGVHAVREVERAELAIRVSEIALDRGEASFCAKARLVGRPLRRGRPSAGNRPSRGVYEAVARADARRPVVGGGTLNSAKNGVRAKLRAARSSASSASTGRIASRSSLTSREAASSGASPPTTGGRGSPSSGGVRGAEGRQRKAAGFRLCRKGRSHRERRQQPPPRPI